MANMVITGATSMIGIALIDAVIKNAPNSKIYALVRENSSNISRLPKHKSISIVECNTDKYEELPKLIHEKCDIFYHIAWSVTGHNRNDDIVGQCKNIEYTLQALKSAYALGCSKFIGAGSQAEYGVKDIEKISPSTLVDPVQAYGVAKYAAGKLSSMQAEKYGMDCLWVRIFSIYGRYEKKTTMIQSTIRKLLAGERPSFTPLEQKWDYLYSSDAGEAFYKIGEKATGNKVYCLGCGQAKPLKEYVQIISRIINPDIPLGIGELSYPENAVMNLCADISDLQRDTDWNVTTSFEDGISKTLEFVRMDIK